MINFTRIVQFCTIYLKIEQKFYKICQILMKYLQNANIFGKLVFRQVFPWD